MDLKIQLESEHINKWETMCNTNEKFAASVLDALQTVYPEREFRIIDENNKKYKLQNSYV